MMTIQPPKAASRDPKTEKRSVLGLLFKPQLGPAFSPLRESTTIFVHLVALVFSMYKLFPKDHPALRDEKAPLSLMTVFRTAWSNVRLTREGAPQAIMFFAVTGIMAFSGLMAVLALLSLFVSHAHAQVVTGASAFAPESNDLAQAWMDYLFGQVTGASFPTGNDTYGDSTVSLQDPFAGSISLQGALLSALAFYSDAILMVAAIILFYHLAAMVVETAHHGQVMGKRASQIWAPIRLVVAIGLLVPINSGLNCGQFIVLKVAELGSGMASNAWDVFLNQLASYNTKATPPSGPIVQQVALDIIRMEACRAAWNFHVDEVNNNAAPGGGIPLSGATMTPVSKAFTLGNIPGTKVSYSSTAFGDVDICGWYFIPSGAANSSGTSTSQAAASAMANATSSWASGGQVQTAANKITLMIPPSQAGGSTTPPPPATSITLDSSVLDAVAAYQLAVDNAMQNLASQTSGNQMASAIQTIKPYGWVMAGSFLNTIDRMQADLASSAADALPKTEPPKLSINVDKEKSNQSWWSWLFSSSEDAWSMRQEVAKNMASFDFYAGRSIMNPSSSPQTADAQCAAMIGLDAAAGNGATGVVNWMLGKVDYLAQQTGVWSAGSGVSCGNSSSTPQTFTLGVQINGKDPLAQMAFLGHANLDLAMDLVAYSMTSKIAGGVAQGASSIPFVGPLIGGAGALASAGGDIMMFFAVLFFICGFTLAYMVPLMPFMRFFFAVLSWVGAIIEAIIAMPLVALAHLNPEGEGLSGQQARAAYFFVFNLFLRPILTVFGLICGLIVFMIAVSFLNYGYMVAVAGAGGTAYGHAALSRIVYSILYVGILYTCANHCFMLIDHLPANAMSWFGGQAQAMPKMGDVDKIEAIGGLVSSYGGQAAIKGVGAVSSQIGAAGGRLTSAGLAKAGVGQPGGGANMGAGNKSKDKDDGGDKTKKDPKVDGPKGTPSQALTGGTTQGNYGNTMIASVPQSGASAPEAKSTPQGEQPKSQQNEADKRSGGNEDVTKMAGQVDSLSGRVGNLEGKGPPTGKA